MSALSTLAKTHRAAIDRCVYCPKLCRFACPVAEAEGRETVTPWGLMTLVDDVTAGRTPLNAVSAEVWTHCTGCLQCQSACKHGNDVAGVLKDARALAHTAGVLTQVTKSEPKAPQLDTAMLVYGAADAALINAARVLLHAVGVTQLGLSQTANLKHLKQAQRIVCLDPVDVIALRAQGLTAQHLTEAVADLPSLTPRFEGDVLYLDSCRLGRGLGIYDVPRRLLAQAITGQIHEATMTRAEGGCCGAGDDFHHRHPVLAAQVAQESVQDVADVPVVVAAPGCTLHLKSSIKRPSLHWAVLIADALECS